MAKQQQAAQQEPAAPAEPEPVTPSAGNPNWKTSPRRPASPR